MPRRSDVLVLAEGDRNGIHHLSVDRALVGGHERPTDNELIVRTGLDPLAVPADKRCETCWASFQGEGAVPVLRDVAALGRQRAVEPRRGGRRRR